MTLNFDGPGLRKVARGIGIGYTFFIILLAVLLKHSVPQFLNLQHGGNNHFNRLLEGHNLIRIHMKMF